MAPNLAASQLIKAQEILVIHHGGKLSNGGPRNVNTACRRIVEANISVDWVYVLRTGNGEDSPQRAIDNLFRQFLKDGVIKRPVCRPPLLFLLGLLKLNFPQLGVESPLSTPPSSPTRKPQGPQGQPVEEMDVDATDKQEKETEKEKEKKTKENYAGDISDGEEWMDTISTELVNSEQLYAALSPRNSFAHRNSCVTEPTSRTFFGSSLDHPCTG